MWEKKVKSNRGGKIEGVIANGCYCYCRRAPRHSGGSEDTVYFCANLHSEGPSRSLSPPHLCPPSYPWAPFSFSSLLTHSWYSNSSFSYLNYTFIGYYPAAGWGSAWLGLTAVQAAAERVLNREEPSKCSKDHRTVALSVTGRWGFEPVDSFLQGESVSPPREKPSCRCRLSWEAVSVRKQQAFLTLTASWKRLKWSLLKWHMSK